MMRRPYHSSSEVGPAPEAEHRDPQDHRNTRTMSVYNLANRRNGNSAGFRMFRAYATSTQPR